MIVNMMKFLVTIWLVLAGMVIVLALYRNLLAKGHFTVLHVRRSEMSLVPGEAAYAQRLDRLDWWGKALTFATVIYGFALAVGCLYFIFQTSLD